MTPRDLSKCAVGQAKYVLVCDSDGGIINDPVLTRMDENTFWFALASSDTLLWARGLKNAYPDLDVTIKEADVAPLQVQGPKSKDLMVDLVGESILDIKYYWFTEAEIAGASVVITRTGWTSEVGYEVYLTDTSKGTEVYEALMKAGEKYNIKPTGPSDIRRIEGAIFNWGADMTYENNAFEMGLDRLVNLDTVSEDACISIKAYKDIKAKGVDRKINGVELDGDPFPALNNVKWDIRDGGAKVGKVTSAIYSPRLKKNIGYAWLPADRSSLGTKISVETEWGTRAATVVEMPFVDPSKQIPVSRRFTSMRPRGPASSVGRPRGRCGFRAWSGLNLRSRSRLNHHSVLGRAPGSTGRNREDPGWSTSAKRCSRRARPSTSGRGTASRRTSTQPAQRAAPRTTSTTTCICPGTTTTR